MMNMRAAGMALVAGALMMASERSEAVAFDFASLNGGSIYFDGSGNFEFMANGSGRSFEITNGGGAGLEGHITGAYSIGPVTTLFGVSTAQVTGAGTFLIDDGGDVFSASITWDSIIQAGVGSTLNFQGNVNMTNLSYTGSNADLLQLVDDGAAINTVTFQFTQARTLNNLKTTETATSFSGSVASVNLPDGGSSAALLSLAFVGMGAMARRRR